MLFFPMPKKIIWTAVMRSSSSLTELPWRRFPSSMSTPKAILSNPNPITADVVAAAAGKVAGEVVAAAKAAAKVVVRLSRDPHIALGIMNGLAMSTGNRSSSSKTETSRPCHPRSS